MSLPIKRVIAALLAVSAAYVGVWAAAFPASFYRDFPLPGRNWVSMLGPYNEHLTRDVGALYLALLVVSVWAFRRPSATAMAVTGGAWLMFNAQHFLWHSLHLSAFPMIDKIGNVTSLGVVLILSILLLLPTREVPTREVPTREAST
ncbi:hypothetical protein [Actinoplanes sp. NBRC 103695]|uniref:hypothetical protein n=1 Tax=Actinoplanes sp. NBRC 103695 TaxID=3032202 RepID=UPI0024A20BC0|nr:hypothetical protein [Actinoplanes sp. NBRC 103695]GLY97476.1 hypothetical protein Acsp02_47300 [Actinoplanes sp. NBRC 103695]